VLVIDPNPPQRRGKDRLDRVMGIGRIGRIRPIHPTGGRVEGEKWGDPITITSAITITSTSTITIDDYEHDKE
jgi:hypothetical protein